MRNDGDFIALLTNPSTQRTRNSSSSRHSVCYAAPIEGPVDSSRKSVRLPDAPSTAHKRLWMLRLPGIISSASWSLGPRGTTRSGTRKSLSSSKPSIRNLLNETKRLSTLPRSTNLRRISRARFENVSKIQGGITSWRNFHLHGHDSAKIWQVPKRSCGAHRNFWLKWMKI